MAAYKSHTIKLEVTLSPPWHKHSRSCDPIDYLWLAIAKEPGSKQQYQGHAPTPKGAAELAVHIACTDLNDKLMALPLAGTVPVDTEMPFTDAFENLGQAWRELMEEIKKGVQEDKERITKAWKRFKKWISQKDEGCL